jgi:tetratricopeptide (TPR) repeat protein
MDREPRGNGQVPRRSGSERHEWRRGGGVIALPRRTICAVAWRARTLIEFARSEELRQNAMRLLLTALICLAAGAVWASGLDDANDGLAAARRGDYDEAIRLFGAAIGAGDLSPSNVMLAHHNRGNAYQDKGDYAHAIAEYDTALKLAPDYAESYYARGRARFGLGEFPAAVADFATSAKLDPNDAYAALWLYLSRRKTTPSDGGALARAAGRLDSARWPGAVIALYLGKVTEQEVRTLSRQGDGEHVGERACEAAFYIGEYELLLRNTDAAKAQFEDALKLCPFTTDEYDGADVELKRMR